MTRPRPFPATLFVLVLVGLLANSGLSAGDRPPVGVSDLGPEPWTSAVVSLTSPRPGVWLVRPAQGRDIELSGVFGALPKARVVRVEVDPEHHRDGSIFQIRLFDASGALVVFAGFHLPPAWADRAPYQVSHFSADSLTVQSEGAAPVVVPVGQARTFRATKPAWSLRLLAVRPSPGPEAPLVYDDPGDRCSVLWVRED